MPRAQRMHEQGYGEVITSDSAKQTAKWYRCCAKHQDIKPEMKLYPTIAGSLGPRLGKIHPSRGMK